MKKKRKKKNLKITAASLVLCLVMGLSFGLTPIIGTAAEVKTSASEETPTAENPSSETAAMPDETDEPDDSEPEAGPEPEVVSEPETTENTATVADLEEQTLDGADGDEIDEMAETKPAEISPMSAGSDYYVVWDKDSKLTFQNQRPESGTENMDFWGQNSTDSFLAGPLSTTDWHTSDMKNRITSVEFKNDIELYGRFMFEEFTALESVTGEGKVTLGAGASHSDPSQDHSVANGNGNGMFEVCSQ